MFKVSNSEGVRFETLKEIRTFNPAGINFDSFGKENVQSNSRDTLESLTNPNVGSVINVRL